MQIPRIRIEPAWVLGLAVGLTAGCLRIDAFECQRNSDCVLDGVAGTCVLNQRTCVYPDGSCASLYATADGECVAAPLPGGASDSGSADAAGSTSVDPGSDGEPGSDGGLTGEPPDETTSGGGETPTTTGQPTGCVGPMDDITAQGVVSANSVFNDDFQPYLGVDGSYASSWFSSGPEPDGGPTLYTWSVLSPLCIAQVSITGNGLHQNPSFREDYGFEHMIVRVYDDSEAIVFQQMFNVLGTPDPPVVAYPDVEGVRVELELYDHESNNCGGFSELEIIGN